MVGNLRSVNRTKPDPMPGNMLRVVPLPTEKLDRMAGSVLRVDRTVPVMLLPTEKRDRRAVDLLRGQLMGPVRMARRGRHMVARPSHKTDLDRTAKRTRMTKIIVLR